MADRILKDSICESQGMADLSTEAEVFFYRLLVQCDDRGRIESNPTDIIARCFPLRIDSVSTDGVQGWIAELLQAGLIALRTIGGVEYIQLRRNDLWQNISKRLPPAEWVVLRATIFERDGYTCQYCGQHGGRLQCDHIIPISRGGGNEPSNLTTACMTCNQAKHNKTPEEWKR